MVFYDKPDSVCRFFPIGFVKINDKDICVAVFVENILTYDVPEPVVAAFEMSEIAASFISRNVRLRHSAHLIL